ncbi:MAG: endo alpha-1,4 polygalactosaminidase [Hyphomicrobiaceae bacterium]|nr:endo alpha-1,4 polygalactosaminidase [Hyphomicrobiaceae bacterium]
MTNNERGSSTMGLIGRRPLLTSIFAGILALAISGTGRLLWKAYGGRSIKWAAFYGVEANEDLLGSYELVILDPEYRGSIKAISERGARICAYLSLAEIRTANPYFASLDKAAVIGENPDWPGTLRVDVRHPAWKKLLLDEQIPHAIARGFSGVMFDTVDTPPYLEQINPKAHKGMRDAAIDLIAAVRNRYPGLELIGNRGYMMLPDIVGILDAVIAESLISMPRKDGSGYTWVPEKEVEAQLAFIRKAKRIKPDLPILSLDYWNPDDIATIAQIYRRERAMGHHPYVSTHSLDRIVAEPPQA